MKTIQINSIVRNCNIGNAILRQIERENNVSENNNYLDSTYKYVQQIQCTRFGFFDASYHTTTYKGMKFKVSYFSGCFYPFIVRIE